VANLRKLALESILIAGIALNCANYAICQQKKAQKNAYSADASEIRKTSVEFMKAELAENVDVSYSFFDNYVFNSQNGKKVKFSKEILKKSFEKNAYEQFSIENVLDEKSIVIYSCNQLKAHAEKTKQIELFNKFQLTGKDYAANLIFKKGFIYDSWDIYLRKIKGRWKIIGISG